MAKLFTFSILILILSSCSVKKFKTIDIAKEDKIVQQSEAIEAISESKAVVIDSTKEESQNKTIVEVFNESGVLIKRITKQSSKATQKAIKSVVIAKDSISKKTKLKVNVKSKNKASVKKVESNSIYLNLILCLVVAGAWYYVKRR